MKITREMLGGSRHVSKLHAIIRREGPEYRIEDRSANGTYRLAPSSWIRLQQNTKSKMLPLISVGDRLRFGDVECTVASQAKVHG